MIILEPWSAPNGNLWNIPNRQYLASAEIVQPIWKNWNYVIPLLYSKSGKQMENYCKCVRYHVDLQLKFTVPSLLIKLVHNCYLNSLFFTALLKTWERNEKGTENMSDMPRSAPFTMHFFLKFPRTPRKVSGTSRLRFRLAAHGNGIFRFFCKSLLEGLGMNCSLYPH